MNYGLCKNNYLGKIELEIKMDRIYEACRKAHAKRLAAEKREAIKFFKNFVTSSSEEAEILRRAVEIVSK